MGKHTFNFGKQAKEKARQQKQMEKASKRMMAKQQKANMKASTLSTGPDMTEPVPTEEIAGSNA